MKIGIITEGSAEQKSLVEIVQKLRNDGITLVNPVFAPIEPKATSGQIVKAAEDRVNLLHSRGCDRIILILDLEDNQDCIIERKDLLESEFEKRGMENVCCVIKKRQFENWLLADLDAIKLCKNFKVTRRIRGLVEPNKADNIQNPVGELSKLKNNRKSFHKNADALAIAKKCDIKKMSKNSRSFRRFLRLVDHPLYQGQSRTPCK
ncbi:MAG: DUF4276 family protein [Bacteroidetes bacterium]|nr:DUF4276 family protein [Bacteroidota bacterium]